MPLRRRWEEKVGEYGGEGGRRWRRKWEKMEEKVGEDGGEGGRRWRRKWEKMEEKAGEDGGERGGGVADGESECYSSIIDLL
jgi:hypothetical protein